MVVSVRRNVYKRGYFANLVYKVNAKNIIGTILDLLSHLQSFQNNCTLQICSVFSLYFRVQISASHWENAK